MARINLLPWRDKLRKQKQDEFVVSIAVVALVTIGIMFGIQTYLDGEIETQRKMKGIVNAKVAELRLITKKIKDIKEKKTIIDNKREAIQRLQKSRPEIVHFIDEVAKVTPEGVYLTKLQQETARVIMQGKTQSNARVSAFMRNVEASKWLVDPVLNIIKGSRQGGNGKMSDFTLYVKQWGNKVDEDM